MGIRGGQGCGIFWKSIRHDIRRRFRGNLAGAHRDWVTVREVRYDMFEISKKRLEREEKSRYLSSQLS
jgi:hypothetical protein